MLNSFRTQIGGFHQHERSLFTTRISSKETSTFPNELTKFKNYTNLNCQKKTLKIKTNIKYISNSMHRKAHKKLISYM